MNDRLQGVNGEEHGPRREMAAFSGQKAACRSPPILVLAGRERVQSEAPANTKSGPPEKNRTG
jgi:hypothetical protein